MRKRMFTTGLAVMCGLVLTATGLWASAASEAEPAAAADREMVRDPATGQMILKPQYGGSLAEGTGPLTMDSTPTPGMGRRTETLQASSWRSSASRTGHWTGTYSRTRTITIL